MKEFLHSTYPESMVGNKIPQDWMTTSITSEDLRVTFLLLAGLFRAIECIGVSRDSSKSRQETLEEMKYRAVTTRGQWPHICVFSEGISVPCSANSENSSVHPQVKIAGGIQPPCWGSHLGYVGSQFHTPSLKPGGIIVKIRGPSFDKQ